MSIQWKPVDNHDDIKVGSRLKVVGLRDSYSLKSIKVKKLIDTGGEIEVILKKKSNLYFNLTAYLHWKKTGEATTVGRWVKELYVEDNK